MNNLWKVLACSTLVVIAAGGCGTVDPTDPPEEEKVEVAGALKRSDDALWGKAAHLDGQEEWSEEELIGIAVLDEIVFWRRDEQTFYHLGQCDEALSERFLDAAGHAFQLSRDSLWPEWTSEHFDRSYTYSVDEIELTSEGEATAIGRGIWRFWGGTAGYRLIKAEDGWRIEEELWGLNH